MRGFIALKVDFNVHLIKKNAMNKISLNFLIIDENIDIYRWYIVYTIKTILDEEISFWRNLGKNCYISQYIGWSKHVKYVIVRLLQYHQLQCSSKMLCNFCCQGDSNPEQKVWPSTHVITGVSLSLIKYIVVNINIQSNHIKKIFKKIF